MTPYKIFAKNIYIRHYESNKSNTRTTQRENGSYEARMEELKNKRSNLFTKTNKE